MLFLRHPPLKPMFPQTPDTATPCSYFPATFNRKSQEIF
ncbi:unnamed protein product [Ectocarpus sp. CCAP 1310/34]|nr:unnamed protein product [Ectocarpus sp. CCAP 1310/34]